MQTSPSGALIDGRAEAGLILTAAAGIIRRIDPAHRPGLAVILANDDPASASYVRSKKAQAEKLGMAFFLHRLPASTSEADLLSLVGELCRDDTVHGLLVQLPLPPHINSRAVLEAVTPEKDVDGFHPLNRGRLITGGETLVPCTPAGCMRLIRKHAEKPDGLAAVVIGRSAIVGQPMAQLLGNANCTVTVCHSHSRNPAAICRRADILVAAAGQPGLVTEDWVKPGAIVIDVGFRRVRAPDGSMHISGDVCLDRVRPLVRAITPVPGGVGPMTIAMLMKNTLLCHARKAGNPEQLAQVREV